ncbi:MAG: thioredoxin family protein [archaeon]
MKQYLGLAFAIPFFLLGCPKQKPSVTLSEPDPEKNIETILEQEPEEEIQLSHIYWQSDYDTAIQLAEELDRSVMMDFSADWCGPCRNVEQNVFSDPELVSLSEDFVNLRMDLSRPDEESLTYEKDYDLYIQAQAVSIIYNVDFIPRVIFLIDGDEQFRINPSDLDFTKDCMREVLETYEKK